MPDFDHPILVLNAGSSTLKFALLRQERLLWKGVIDRLDQHPHAKATSGEGTPLFDQDLPATGYDQALDWLMTWDANAANGPAFAAVGHRVVHGGARFVAPVRITPEVLRQLEALVPLAPLHQPHSLAPIKFLAKRRPELPQIACFDTAFHAAQPKVERLFALPRAYFEHGIQRYGFHGLSYEYIASLLPQVDPRAAAGRTVVCHLGNGASMCALLAGKSQATTMSFTALDGLPMGTRCGAIDPGVLLHLLSEQKMDAARLTDLLYKQSGLLGLSGISADMRDLLNSPASEAAEAVDYFCYRAAKELGALAAVLGGLDALVFTAGIGEHAAPVRAKICERAAWLGVRLDADANARHQTAVHAAGSPVHVLVLPTDEECMIARHVKAELTNDEPDA